MLIIFDCDGVLRSISLKGLFEAYTAIIRYKRKDYREFFTDIYSFGKWFSHDWHYNLKRIGGFSENEFAMATKIFHEHYDKYVSVFPWVRGILDELSKNHKLALLSSSSIASVRGSLGDSCDLFLLMIGNGEVSKIKPHPEGVHLIVDRLAGQRESTIIIGDGEVDILAGKSAGVKTGAVSWGGVTELDDLKKLSPDMIIHTPADLLEL